MTKGKKRKSGGAGIDTGGAAYVGGDVHAEEFVGGDKVIQVGERSVVAGSIKESFIQTGDTVGVQQGATVEQFLELLAEIRRLLAESGLDKDTIQVVDGEYREVEERASKPKPNRAVILGKLKGAAEALTTAAAAAEAGQKLLPLARQAAEAGQKLLPLARQAAEWAGQLFR